MKYQPRMAAIVRLLAKPRLLTTNSLPSTVQTRLPSVGRSSLRTGSACCVRRVSDGRTSRNRDCSVWPFTRFFNPRKKNEIVQYGPLPVRPYGPRLTGLGSGSASGNGQPRRSLAPTSHYGSAPCGVASAHRESFRSKI